MLNDKIRSLYIWGDSVIKGIIFDEAKKRYTIPENNNATVLEKILGIKIINRAKMGCTANKGMELVSKDLSEGAHCDAALLEFGGNDCDFDWKVISENPDKVYLPKNPLQSFRENIENMLSLVRKNNITPVLMNLPPIDSQRYFDFISRGLNAANILKWLGEKEVIYRHHECYSKELDSIAKKEGCLILDIRSAFMTQKNFSDFLCMDGIHPNEKGQQLMRDVFLTYANSIK